MAKSKERTSRARPEPITMDNYSPLYGLFGDDSLERDRFLQKLREVFAAVDVTGMNHEKFDARETPGDVILACARSLPMFSGARLVEVRHVDALTAAQLEPYLGYLEHPNESTCLVFVGEGVDKKKKFFKILEQKANMQWFQRGNRTQMMAAVRTELERSGLRFDPEVPSLLVDLLGAQDLKLSLDKLILLKAGDMRSKLTAEQVLLAVGDDAESAVFSFIDAVFARNIQGCFEQLKRLKEDRQQSPIAVIGLMGRQLRSLVYLKSKVPVPGVPPFLIAKLEPVARTLSFRQLFDWHSALLDADRRCKSSRAEPWMVFEAMLFALFASGAGKGKN